MSADTQLMIFDLKSLIAEGSHTYGAPLTLKLTSKHGQFELVVYTDDVDLTNRLEVAINNAVAKPQPAAETEHEREAYNAQRNIYEYRGGSR